MKKDKIFFQPGDKVIINKEGYILLVAPGFEMPITSAEFQNLKDSGKVWLHGKTLQGSSSYWHIDDMPTVLSLEAQHKNRNSFQEFCRKEGIIA
jgi:hypothetical protein